MAPPSSRTRSLPAHTYPPTPQYAKPKNTYVHACKYIHIYIYICTYECTYIHLKNTYTYVTRLHIYIYIWIYIRTRVKRISGPAPSKGVLSQICKTLLVLPKQTPSSSASPNVLGFMIHIVGEDRPACSVMTHSSRFLAKMPIHLSDNGCSPGSSKRREGTKSPFKRPLPTSSARRSTCMHARMQASTRGACTRQVKDRCTSKATRNAGKF